VAWACERHARKAVKLSSHKVAKRVAGQGIHSQKSYVEKQNQGSDSHPDLSVKKESTERIAPQENEEDESYIQEVAMEVLKNKRKRSLASVTVLTAFADRTGWRVEEKSPVVSLSIVIAGDPKSQRPNQNQ
jgi:hypothetical protein